MLSKSILKNIRFLHTLKGRKEQGLFIVEGQKSVLEFISEKWDAKYLVMDSRFKPELKELKDAVQISEKEFRSISNLKNPEGIMGVFQQRHNNSESLRWPIFVFEDIRNPGNMGTIIRTLDWFGATRMICSPDSADCYNPKVVQASMGSLSRVKVEYKQIDEEIKTLRELHSDVNIIGMDLSGEILSNNNSKKNVFIFGNESHGLSDKSKELCDALTRIPGFGKAESLNIAISVGITAHMSFVNQV